MRGITKLKYVIIAIMCVFQVVETSVIQVTHAFSYQCHINFPSTLAKAIPVLEIRGAPLVYDASPA